MVAGSTITTNSWKRKKIPHGLRVGKGCHTLLDSQSAAFPEQELVWSGGKGGQALLSVSHCRFCTQLQVAEKHRQKKIIIIK